MLVNLVIHDNEADIKSKLSIIADDTKLCWKIKEVQNVATLQKGLNKIEG